MRAFIAGLGVVLTVMFAAENQAVACPFCGGEGSSAGTLLDIIVVVAVMWLAARTLRRAMHQREAKRRAQDGAADGQ